MKQSTKLDPAAAQAKSDRLAVGRIWEILHKATVEERKTIAALAILQSKDVCEIDFYISFVKINRAVVEANKLLQEITNAEEKIALSIAILEGIE
ncbi:hypothetical protein PN499_26645 [Kamptonema animale CS-326]|jgi:hypothetical protein|uniref:hypothetical protein n=1 Tax=Kamptonema animale TaxID=92934 RepID=UPI00232D4AD3|nr:hypothetical protein [Kamptonema animale]MDB9514787.1 hypothetical protein [Kamptonema animale CS-326]